MDLIRQEVVLNPSTWELLLTKMVSKTVDERGHGNQDIKRVVRSFLPRIPFQPVNLDENPSCIPNDQCFPKKGDKGRLAMDSKSHGEGFKGWIVWNGSCPRNSQETEVDLSKAGIVRIEDIGHGSYQVLDSISFQEVPKRFYLRDFDALDYLMDRYDYEFEDNVEDENVDFASVRAPNYRRFDLEGETMGYSEGAQIHLVKISQTWYSVLLGTWEALLPCDNGLEIYFSVVPPARLEELGLKNG